MKKIISIITIICILCMTGCALKETGGGAENTVRIEYDDIADNTTDNTADWIIENPIGEIAVPEIEYGEVSTPEERIERFQLLLDGYRPPLKDENAQILQLSGNLSLDMDEACYPKLRESLSQYSAKVQEDMLDNSNRVIVHRADKQVLSFLEKKGSYGFYVSGYNYDTETGQLIELSNVVNDMDKLAEIIAKQLIDRYPDIRLGDNLAKRIRQLCNDSAAVTWTINYHGLCLYLSTEILSVEDGLNSPEGILHAVITFSDMPELFNEKYRKIPEAYAIELEDVPFLYDIDADGSLDLIKTCFYQEDEEKDFSLIVNGQVESGKYEQGAFYDQSRRAYLLHMAENKNYIVFYERGDLDCTGVYSVYTVEGGNIKHVESDSSNIYLGNNRITDPASIWLTNAQDPLLSGLMLIETEFFIDENASFKNYNDIYYYLDSDRELKTLRELNVVTVDSYTGRVLESDVTLSPNTFMEPLRTDLYTWCDFVIEDSRVCRIIFDAPINDSLSIPMYDGMYLIGECISIDISETKLRLKYSDNSVN
ncbi:MAG: hypothetical protein NC433_03700 [Clostridiales bacterium]|nr:hypothetical protein [Clostridiales bacterium]